MGIGGSEDLALEVDHVRVFDGGLDDRSPKTPAAVSLEYEDVGQPRKGRQVADHASEPDLRAFGRVRTDNECAVSDRHRNYLSRPSGGPVRMVAEVVMDNIDVDEPWIATYAIVRDLRFHTMHQSKATKWTALPTRNRP